MSNTNGWARKEDTNNMFEALRDELELLGVSKKIFATASYNASKKELDSLKKCISELDTEEERTSMTRLQVIMEEYLQNVKEAVDNMED